MCRTVHAAITVQTRYLHVDGMVTFSVNEQILVLRWGLDLHMGSVYEAHDPRHTGRLAEPLLHRRRLFFVREVDITSDAAAQRQGSPPDNPTGGRTLTMSLTVF